MQKNLTIIMKSSKLRDNRKLRIRQKFTTNTYKTKENPTKDDHINNYHIMFIVIRANNSKKLFIRNILVKNTTDKNSQIFLG